MGKVDLEYINRFPDRHGRMRTYFRVGGKRFPLPDPTDPTFSEEYGALLAEHAPEAAAIKRHGRKKPQDDTLDWVILKYKTESADWKKTKPSTKEVYDRRFDWLSERYGAAQFSSFTEKGVRKIRNKLKEHPSVADATVDMIGRLWRFAKEHIDGMDEIGANPSTEVASIHTEHRSAPAWPEELCKKFEDLRSRPKLRRAYYLLRYTGQRRSDIVKMARSQYDGSAVEVVQEKTGTYVWVPAHKLLREHLAEGIDGDYLLTSSRGGKFKATSITNMICDQCAEFGFPGYSPHGLRHLAGSALAEAGATIEQIKSILGHLTDDEARKYVQQANRKVMAADGMRLWETAEVRRLVPK